MSTFAAYDFVISRARTELPGVSDAGVKQALYEVYHEFCNFASAWQEDIDVTLVANTQDYDLVPENPAVIQRLLVVRDSLLTPWGGVLLRDSVDGSTKLRLQSIPSTGGDVFTATVALNVVPVQGDDVPFVPQWFFDLYNPVIMAGVFGTLFEQPTKPYSDQQRAVYWLKKFNDGKAQVRTAVMRQFTHGVNAWAYPRSFRTSGQRGAR